jgi:hypothetical protein
MSLTGSGTTSSRPHLTRVSSSLSGPLSTVLSVRSIMAFLFLLSRRRRSARGITPSPAASSPTLRDDSLQRACVVVLGVPGGMQEGNPSLPGEPGKPCEPIRVRS